MFFFVPYAFKTVQGSYKRCDALQKSWSNAPQDDSLIILTAGYSQISPMKSTPYNRTCLAEAMENHIRSTWGRKAHIFAKPLTWTTLGETISAISVIRTKLTKDDNAPHIYVASNLMHLLRVYMCWEILSPITWQIHYVVSKNKFGIIDNLREIPAIIFYVLLLARHKFF